MSKQLKHVWATKQIGKDRAMICQNSNPIFSKYPEWGPDSGICENWVKVGQEAVACLCSDCVQRSLKV